MKFFKLALGIIVLGAGWIAYQDLDMLTRFYQQWRAPAQVSQIALPNTLGEAAGINAPVVESGAVPGDELGTLLYADERESIIEWLRANRAQLSESKLNEIYRRLFEKANAALRRQDYAAATRWALVLKDEQPRSASVHKLLGDIALADDRVVSAIMSYYDARNVALQGNETAELTRQIKRVVNSYADKLEKRNEWRALSLFYSRLLQIDPTAQDYYLSLARAHVALNDNEAALRVLNMTQFDESYSGSVAQIRQQIENKMIDPLAMGHRVSVSTLGSHFIVPVILDDAQTVPLLLDTGASMTVVNRQVASELGLDFVEPLTVAEVSTANGIALADIYQLQSLQIGEMRLSSVNIAVMDLQDMDSNAQGLLGMNVLGKFEFSVDQQNQRLLLKAK